MANEKISELPTVTSSLLADLIPAVQGGVTVQETLQQVYNLMLSQTILNFAGNPNSHIAGVVYQLCWDTTDHVLYVCTTSGDASTAVWTASIEGTVVTPTIANHVIVSTDTSGTLGNLTGIAIQSGSLQAGLSGTAGSLVSFPAGAALGSLALTAANSAGNFAGVITNASLGQASTWTLADPSAAASHIAQAPAALVNNNLVKASGVAGLLADSGLVAANVAVSTLSSPDPQSDLIWYDVTCTFTALAAAGTVIVQTSSGSKQYKVRDVKMNYGASGLSGGGGDRLISLTDGTTVFNNAGITAALLGTPVNTVWGGSGNPVAGAVAQNTSTVAGANLYFQYAGGTVDYTAGSVVISVLLQRVA